MPVRRKEQRHQLNNYEQRQQRPRLETLVTLSTRTSSYGSDNGSANMSSIGDGIDRLDDCGYCSWVWFWAARAGAMAAAGGRGVGSDASCATT